MIKASARTFIYTALRGRVIFGTGARKRIAEELASLQCTRACILSGTRGADDAKELQDILGSQAVGSYSGAAMHTPVEVTEQALQIVRARDADALITVGGGSATGLGKAIALRTDLPLIVLPTTYAGSEMTPILGQTEAGRKTTIRDPKVLPEVVIYDPELTYSLPPTLAATSGMNAIAHAVEALYAKDANPITSMLATEGIGALTGALPKVMATPTDEDARANALYGSWLCGTVLGSVGMALHHKLCHVLGGTFNLPHAETHAVILPHAASFNAEAVPDLLKPVTDLLGGHWPGQALYDLAKRIHAPTSLRELGLPHEALGRAADVAMEQPYWNPRPVTRDGLRTLLEEAWSGERPHH
jgi:maleylacetate reductase